MGGWEAGFDDGKECAGHVGLHPLVVGGVEPGDAPFSAFLPWLVCPLVHPGWVVDELLLFDI